MNMIIKNISEAKAELSALLEQVLKGEEVIIGKAGVPIARIVRYSGLERARTPGALRGKITIAPDFDELPDDIAESLGVKP
jgi:prevent-host-death family protein